MVADWADEYVGIPWRWRGRDRDGVDCWGLVCLVFWERRSMRLPEYTYHSVGGGGATIEAERRHWRRITRPQVMDVAMIDACRRQTDGSLIHGVWHLGINVGGGYILHTIEGLGVVLMRACRLKIEGWYRHEP